MRLCKVEYFTKKVTSDFHSMMKSFSPKGKHIILGFSGGADSSALFDLLYKNREVYDYTLSALHVNHMIRAAEADRDEEFCKALCENHSIKIEVVRTDVPKLASDRSKGLEETARDVRYAAFENECRKYGNNTLVATAHNADDNAETVIFNLVRGTSLAGLSGIKPRRGNIIRPILLSTKEEIIGYCEENCVKYIVDSTNSDTAYTRNRIRHLVIPELKKVNPALCEALIRTGNLINADNEYIDAAASDFICKNVTDTVDLNKLNTLHIAVKSRVVRDFLKSNGASEISEIHIADVLSLCENAVPHSKVSLPGMVSARIENGSLTVCNTVRIKEPVSFCHKIEYGVTIIPETGDIVARIKESDTEALEKFKNVYKIFIQTRVTSATIVGDVFVRPRHEGDKISINGVSRKVKKLLSEICPDLEIREKLPLFCDGDSIIWVPGARSRTGSFPKSGDAAEIFLYAANKDNSQQIKAAKNN